ncbi:MAG TPA: DUF962 domain-containing protein [Gemmataceae bacterium]|jgi:hypothetical protein
MGQEFRSFAEFYPFYLREHSTRANRRAHFLGLTAAVALLIAFAVTLNWWLLLAVPVAGYGVSWVGHFVFERNVPATFGHPWYSFLGDLALCRDILTGRIKF